MIDSPFKIPRILPPKGHPRLMLTKDDIPRIKKNMSHPENLRAVEILNRLLSRTFDEFYDEIKYGGYNMFFYLMLEAKAFDCLINEKPKESRELIELMIKILNHDDKNYSEQHTRGANATVNTLLFECMNSRAGGHAVFVAALIYDWLYDYFKEEERLPYIDACEKLAATTNEYGYPPKYEKEHKISGHMHEAEILKNLLGLGIATYDERPDIYNYIGGMLFDIYYPSYEVQYAGGFHHQGSGYGPYRHSFALWSQLLILSMSGERPMSENIERMSDSYYYMTRADGESLRIGDDCIEDKRGYTMRHPFVIPMFLSAALTGDKRYKQYYKEHYVDEYMLPSWYYYDYYRYGSGCFGEGTYSPIVHLIWNMYTPESEGEPYKKAKHFPYPNGITIYKDEESATTVYMKIGEMWGDLHDHFDTGSFQIYHKGILASDSGAYDIFGTDFHFCYSMKTSAHNCITVTDPKRIGETTKFRYNKTVYDGGVRKPSSKATRSLEAWQKEFRMATVLSHTETDELVEISGDLTSAYRESCDSITRKMSFFPKENLFRVEDNIVAKDESFIKRFHLHMQSEPEINGNEIRFSYKGGTLTCKVLEPVDAKIEAIGGPGKQFMVNGVNYSNAESLHGKEVGWGQVIISPTNVSKECRFVVEMKISDREY